MKVGLVGFAGSGKSTVFQWLTGVKPDPSALQRGQLGIAKIADERLDWLSQHFKPKKTTAATLEFVDTPGLLPTDRKDNPRRLAIIREAGGLLVVLAGFSGDPVQELRNFRDELIFADLEVITNRIGRLEDWLKKPKPAKEKDALHSEIELLRRLTAALEPGQSAATLNLSDEEEKTIRYFQLLTLKPELVLVNTAEDRIGQPLPPELLRLAPNALQAPVKLELELADLSEADREAFMHELGIEDLSRATMLRDIFAAMGQIVFFTVSEEECRAWPIPAGTVAQEGAGTIHTDFAEGFVRAEIIPFEDFKQVGSFKEAKAKGVYRLEGKTYVVKDGDIMHILANR